MSYFPELELEIEQKDRLNHNEKKATNKLEANFKRC